ncbi:FAD/FMN-containing dehydrogenase [Thermoplasmatales archaeon BRNA1]|nr:FAD/FMN-containing dehydrogenase [Thermoplasmatales archaeon BRNA1]
MDSDKLSREVTPEIISKLESAIGKDNVNTHPEERLLYSHDLAPLPGVAGIAFKNIPDVVVRPTCTEDVAAVMRIAYENGVAVTPRGNSTWGLGGCQPVFAGIVVDFSSKMNKIIKLDPEHLCVKVQAGITFKEVLDACMAKGFIIGSYPSSFPAATIGGWYGTNGMGIGTYKFGSVKDNVLNMEVVLPDGSVIETGYDNIGAFMSGYNLNQFFAGAEGTLGLVCTFTLKMYPMGVIRPTIYNFENLADADPAIQAIAKHPSIKPLHVSWADFNHFANQARAAKEEPSIHVHSECKNTVLVVLQGDERFVDLEDEAVEEIMVKAGGQKLPNEIADHEWDERCYEFRARAVGVGEIPAEVIVPSNSWGQFVGECYEGFSKMKMETGGIIGQMVDPQTVLFMPYYFMDNEGMLGMTAFSFNFYLGDVATRYGGRTTGLGVFFAWNLDNIHDANTVEYMRELKTYLDPRDVMNPGHVVCGLTRFGISLSHGLMEFASKMMQTVKKMLPPDSTFADNIERFHYNTLEEEKAADRKHVLGRGYE